MIRLIFIVLLFFSFGCSNELEEIQLLKFNSSCSKLKAWSCEAQDPCQFEFNAWINMGRDRFGYGCEQDGEESLLDS